MKVNWGAVLIWFVVLPTLWVITIGGTWMIFHEDSPIMPKPMIVQEAPMPTYRQMVIEVPMDSTTFWCTVLSNYDTLYIYKRPYRED